MVLLNKGDCDLCGRTYRYSLWHAGFGGSSYAYCEDCGILATFNYSNPILSTLPPLSALNLDIDSAWEPFLHPCTCGGRFRKGASPRCPYCQVPLSAEYAAGHIERNSLGAARGWHWQGNWSGVYCIAIEDPDIPGELRQMFDPVLQGEPVKTKKHWTQMFSFSR